MTGQSKQEVSVRRRLLRGALYNLIPGYPIVKALQSAKKTIGSGALTVRDLTVELENQKPDGQRVRTWREAIESRPVGALPLKKIADDCVSRKRLCMAFACICLSYAIGGMLGANYFAIANGVLGMALPALFIVREEHRLWQMEVGPAQPDAPLPRYRDFFRTRGFVLRLLDARLF
jgi:hypothetical protein